MRIKLVYRNYKKLHTMHSFLVTYPPKGVEYVVPATKSNLRKFYPVYQKLKGTKLFTMVFNFIKRFLFQDNTYEGIDLVHFIQYVPQNWNRNIPYVIDFEHVIGLTDFIENAAYFTDVVIPFLTNDNCKGIIAMSEAAKKTLVNSLEGKPEKDMILAKTEVILPAIPSIDIKRNYNSKKLKFLFVGSQVYRKGLHELLEAFSKIPQEKAELMVVSDISVELKEAYQYENIKYFEPKFTHEEIVKDFFSKADVFVMPTHSDTFGMVYLDAMSCGTPIIATKQFAIPEIVQEGVHGILINTEKQYLWDRPVITEKIEEELMIPEQAMIEELHQAILYCIDNPDKVEKMGANAKKLFLAPDGKFSIQRRNKLINEIYEEANTIS